ncbi:MAG: hypothetical protein NC548_63065, partial [Lachnospiraceae bacterium]|nr:hypothetical protein [Lachnospiraceae bacterium]
MARLVYLLQIALGRRVVKQIISPSIKQPLVNILGFVGNKAMFYSEVCGKIIDTELKYITRPLLEIELKLQEQEAKEAEKNSESLTAQSLAQV